jgi:hypothetical protein
VQWRELSPAFAASDRLPFLKRNVFRFEKEYRIVAVSDRPRGHVLPLAIDLGCVTSIYINGELPAVLFESLAELIQGIPGCAQIPVRQSGLLRNRNWSRSIAGLLS